MKDFFKYVLATFVALILVGVFATLMTFAMLGAALATGDSKPALKEGTVLHLKLSGQLSERSTSDPFAELLQNDNYTSIGLDDLLKAIRVAKNDDKIKGIYLEGGLLSADFASLQELRAALADFKKSKKFIYAYSDNWTQGTYYVASLADKVALNPSGMLDWHGLASQPIFWTDLLKKVGVKVQVFRVGTYKSFVEPFTLTRMSEANRAQVQSFMGDIWQGICKDVATGRGLKADSLNAYADRYITLADTRDYLKLHLVDTLTYADGVRDCLRQLAGTDKVQLISATQLAKLDKPAKASDRIAIYYAEGDIVSDEASTPMSNKAQIVGSKVVKDLDQLMNDDEVKAVVLRINSGGGSAYASEQMWRAIQLLKKKKPVVVSMSGMAASGGYYMSCGADYIVAEPTTLTGSIGIFGLVPDASELLTEKLGLHFDVVKTNASSDFGAMGRPFNPAESAAMQGYVDRGYRLFLQRVAEGRKMKVDEVDRVAQGRVWTGSQALRHKLVDKLGTLDDAVAEAARRAKVADYALATYPAKSSWIQNLMNKAAGQDYMEQKLRLVLGEYYEPLSFVTGLRGQVELQARMLFVPNIH